MVTIAPLGTEVVLPAFLIGWELTGEDWKRVETWRDTPSWLLRIDQQAGGYVMSYPSAVGALLRLTDNVEHSFREAAELVRGFRAMAEEPRVAILEADFPVLADLVGTWGGTYTPEELFRLTRFLRRYFIVPGLESGLEAFVRFEETDLPGTFAEWWVTDATPRESPRQLYSGRPPIDFDDSNIRDLDLSAGPLVVEVFDELLQLGASLEWSPPRVFFMWENSD